MCLILVPPDVAQARSFSHRNDGPFCHVPIYRDYLYILNRSRCLARARARRFKSVQDAEPGCDELVLYTAEI